MRPNRAQMAGAAALGDGPARVPHVARISWIQGPQAARREQALVDASQDLLALPGLEQFGRDSQSDERVRTHRSVRPVFCRVRATGDAVERVAAIVRPEAACKGSEQLITPGAGSISEIELPFRFAELGQDGRGAIPEGLQLDGQAPTWCQGFSFGARIHPGERVAGGVLDE